LNVSEIHNPDIIGKSSGNKIKFSENFTLGIADVLLVYSMLSPIILLIVGAQIKLVPNFFRTLIILLGPGILAAAIYFRAFGIQVLKKCKWIILCMMLFTVVIFLSSIKHIDTELTRESLKFFIAYCLFGFCLGTISNMSILRSKRFNLIWILFITGLLIYAIYDQWPVINRRFYLTGIENQKIVNNAQVGFLFYFFALCVLFKFHSSVTIIEKIVITTLLIACSVVGFYTGSRTAFFGFLISFVLYLFYYSHVNQRKIYAIIILCIIIVISFVLLPNVNQSIIKRYVKAFEDAKNIARTLMSNESAPHHVDVRIRIWQDAFNKFKKNPVLGAGFGISYHDKTRGKSWVHPHNIILEILTELGIVGGAIFLILFGLVFGKVYQILNKIIRADRLIFLFYPLSLIFFFLYSFLHTDLSTEYFKWYFAGIIAGYDTSG
jgi:O-antigen ligase